MPVKAWQLQIAKAKFSELFRIVRLHGPQWVTKQGKESVVIIPAEQFEELLKREAGPATLVEFFAKSPLAGTNIHIERPVDFGRSIEL